MYEIRFTGAAEKYLKKVYEKGLKKAFQVALEELSIGFFRMGFV